MKLSLKTYTAYSIGCALVPDKASAVGRRDHSENRN